MKKELSRFLKEYSTDISVINKLIVSSYLSSKKLFKIKNRLISSLIIKEKSEHFQELNEFSKKFKIDSLEKVFEAFEYVISPEDKIVSGAVYTPSRIRNFILNKTVNVDDLQNLTVCDPACGCAGFLYSAVQIFRENTGKSYVSIIEDNIFGLDIKAYAIERSKILLALLAIENGEDPVEIHFNLEVGNALSFNWEDTVPGFIGFDSVVGNPPYVCSRNIEEESKDLLKNWKVSSTGHPDLYIPFFEVGIGMLKPAGKLGFITMNSFFKSLNGRALREYFDENRFNFDIIDFGGEQVFDSNSTYTCICLIKNIESATIRYAQTDTNRIENVAFDSIRYDSLDAYNGWNLKAPDLTKKIELAGQPFGSLFKTSSGIATLKNNVYIFDAVKEDQKFYYLDENIPIEKKACREIINTNKLTKVDKIDQLKRLIIFPYYYEGNSAKVIPESKFKESFPFTFRYLLSKKTVLATRDKGNGKYIEWYAYGRNQSLEKFKYKLFFPHIAPSTPNFILDDNEDLLFHNGLCLLSNNLNEMLLAKKLMASRLFWFYVENTSKHYGAGYLSLSKNYIKTFGVYDFNEEERRWLIESDCPKQIDKFLEKTYKICL